MTVLETARLRMEPVGPGDLSSLVSHWREPGVRRYLWDGDVVAEEQVRGMIARSAELFDVHAVGLWSVRERHGPRLIGCAGFWHFHDPPEIELVYSLSEAYWRRGLGRECAGTLIRHVFEALDWPVVQASTDAPNESSLALLRALGMQPSGQRPGAFGVIETFTLTREAWLSRGRL